jgi:hypothetical protein
MTGIASRKSGRFLWVGVAEVCADEYEVVDVYYPVAVQAVG